MNRPEHWRPVPGWEGFYEVSDLGQVRSIPRQTTSMTGSKVVVVGQTLIPQPNESGYLFVRLRTRYSYKVRLVHRLVLLAFVGPAPEGTEGCHNDGDKLNNKLNNLRWDTHAANMEDYRRHCIAAGHVL